MNNIRFERTLCEHIQIGGRESRAYIHHRQQTICAYDFYLIKYFFVSILSLSHTYGRPSPHMPCPS